MASDWTFPIQPADTLVDFYRTEVLTGQEAKHLTKSDLVPTPKVPDQTFISYRKLTENSSTGVYAMDRLLWNDGATLVYIRTLGQFSHRNVSDPCPFPLLEVSHYNLSLFSLPARMHYITCSWLRFALGFEINGLNDYFRAEKATTGDALIHLYTLVLMAASGAVCSGSVQDYWGSSELETKHQV